jgi:hypothetical protein
MKERRKQRKARRTEAANSERRQRVQGILAALDLWPRLERTTLAEAFLNSHYPKVHIQLAAELPSSQETTQILKELRKTADEAVLNARSSVITFASRTISP